MNAWRSSLEFLLMLPDDALEELDHIILQREGDEIYAGLYPGPDENLDVYSLMEHQRLH